MSWTQTKWFSNAMRQINYILNNLSRDLILLECFAQKSNIYQMVYVQIRYLPKFLLRKSILSNTLDRHQILFKCFELKSNTRRLIWVQTKYSLKVSYGIQNFSKTFVCEYQIFTVRWVEIFVQCFGPKVHNFQMLG